jgi:general secretion pathway protein G
MQPRPQSGFTLVEFIVAVSVLAILAGAVIPRVTNHLAGARDEQRLADIRAVQAAIEQFHRDKQRYPDARPNASYGGWDVSNDGDFIPELVQFGYLPAPARDPGEDAGCFYAYFLYDRGTAGCASRGKFYVLGIKSFETASFAARNLGEFQCADRDWSAELAYVTGGGLSGG